MLKIGVLGELFSTLARPRLGFSSLPNQQQEGKPNLSLADRSVLRRQTLVSQQERTLRSVTKTYRVFSFCFVLPRIVDRSLLEPPWKQAGKKSRSKVKGRSVLTRFEISSEALDVEYSQEIRQANFELGEIKAKQS